MDDYKAKYEHLQLEYEGYQKISEEKIQELISSNIQLQKNLDMLSNVILISNYINSNLSSKNIISMINDMIIGIIGVTQSTIYLYEDFKFVIKATNGTNNSIRLTKECRKCVRLNKTFILNSKEAIVEDIDNCIAIHSRLGVPIKVGEKFIGYIVVDHTRYNYLTEFHEIFLSSIASQIAIAIENSILYKKIEKAAKYDALLGIYNRNTFYDLIEERLENVESPRYAIVMIDLDNFKKVNDTFGHQFGDKVLIESVSIIRNMLKKKDIIARYGGEEIILYIDRMKDDYKNIFDRMNKIRETVADHIVFKDGIGKKVTASFGIGFYPEDGKSLEKVIDMADKYLYMSKEDGKNKVKSSRYL